MKPLIVYVDDEPQNLSVFEMNMLDEWDCITFEDPLVAIEKIAQLDPWVVVSDQRMKGKIGNELLAAVRAMKPDAIRIITTGYADEANIIDSIKTAHVHDYFVKPWEIEEVVGKLKQHVEAFASKREKNRLRSELEKNIQELTTAKLQLQNILNEQKELAQELKAWVHPFVLKARNENIQFPIYKDLGLLVIDIIDSGKLHGLKTGNQTVRERVLQSLWEIVLKNGGEIESQEGDKAYANFGLLDFNANPYIAALVTAKEYRASLKTVEHLFDIKVEVGISLHVARNAAISVRQSNINSGSDTIIRKKFDTSSSDIDLAHRLESCVHSLPGTNIIMTRDFLDCIPVDKRSTIVPIGLHLFKGQTKKTEVYLVTSEYVKEAHILEFISKLSEQTEVLSARLKAA